MYYHSLRDTKNRDFNKTLLFKEKGIRLIRIKEIKGENRVDNYTVFFNISQGYNNLDWVIARIYNLLNSMTGNEYECKSDFQADRLSILETYRNYVKDQNLCDTNKELVDEWNYEKNGKLRPEFYTSGSPQKVWWKCKDNHEWKATIASRAVGHGCPYCQGILHVRGVNDLATANPEIAKEWDYEKNGSLSPDLIAKGSHLRVWWICPKGHSYQASPLNRTNATNHTGCPYCSNKKVLVGFNDLQTVYPQIAKKWDYSKNGALKPCDVVYGSGKKVFWKCRYCGHEWNCRVLEMKNGKKCPQCHK